MNNACRVLRVRRIGWIARVADAIMVPVMYIVSGTVRESPQKTHAWNVQRLTDEEKGRLSAELMVSCKGVSGVACRRHWWNILFHIPIFGGWRQYVVLKPEIRGMITWRIGWVTSGHHVGISKIPLPLDGSVRMLLGPDDVLFFGVNAAGYQIGIRKIGEGRVGDGGPHSKVTFC